MLRTLLVTSMLLSFSSCSDGRDPGDGSTSTTTKRCTPGATQECVCAGGASGAQSCNDAGSGWQACECGGSTTKVCAPGASQGCTCSNGANGAQSCNVGGTGWNTCACQGGPEKVCAPGVSQQCACAGGGSGAQTCNADGLGYATCQCSTSQCLATGTACGTGTPCCSGATCTNLHGIGAVCAANCSQNSQCNSGCCIPLTSGGGACGLAIYCQDFSSCTAPVGTACTGDPSCCPDPAGVPAICSCAGGACQCKALCAENANCVSGCCYPRSDGLKHCVPSSFCQ